MNKGKLLLLVGGVLAMGATLAEIDAVFSPAFFWMWNSKLEAKELYAQLDEMRAMGIRNVCIHPVPNGFRPGLINTEMSPDYLTPGFLDVFADAVAYAGKLGMHAYLYDEGGWPSGGACGQVAASDPEENFCNRKLVLGKNGPEVIKIPYRKGANEPAAYPSIVERGCVKRFLELTHDQYALAVGKEFGKTVKIAFTDEPEGPREVPGESLGWTDDFEKVFKTQRGYDIMPFVERLIREPDGNDEELVRVRLDYRETLADLYVERYLLPLRDWCRQHDLFSGGHVNGENVPELTRRYGHGNLMRSLRMLDVPGVDVIWRQLFPARGEKPAMAAPFPRYAASAMHQNGGKVALSETFGIFGDSITPAEMKWIVDFQLVRGINAFVFAYYSANYSGQWLDLFEPHSGPVSPLWKFERPFFEYVEKTGEKLSRGRPGAEIAVLYDARGLWAGGAARDLAATNHYAAAAYLDRMNCDYDFVDDHILERAKILPGGQLQVGAMTYRTVVLPTSKWMRPQAKAKLDAWKAAGGQVLTMNEIAKAPRTLAISGAGAGSMRVLKRIENKLVRYFLFNESMAPAACRIEFPDGTATERVFAGGETAFYEIGIGSGSEQRAHFEGSKRILATGWTLQPIVAHEVGKTNFVVRAVNEAPMEAALGDWRIYLGQRFSGQACYRVEFPSTRAEVAELDLGEVKWCASVSLNGKELGPKFFGPYRWPVTLKAGQNLLEVTVANTLANQLGHADVRDRIARDFPPRSAYDRYQAEFDLDNHDSGLFGPVTITRAGEELAGGR